MKYFVGVIEKYYFMFFFFFVHHLYARSGLGRLTGVAGVACASARALPGIAGRLVHILYIRYHIIYHTSLYIIYHYISFIMNYYTHYVSYGVLYVLCYLFYVTYYILYHILSYYTAGATARALPGIAGMPAQRTLYMNTCVHTFLNICASESH